MRDQVVREWITGRKAGAKVGRLLVRVVNMLEMRYRFTLIASRWRACRNVHADYLTGCNNQEFQEIVRRYSWEVVDVEGALKQALCDSERFGPCLLAWETEDPGVLKCLKERRLHRAIPGALSDRCGTAARWSRTLRANEASQGLLGCGDRGGRQWTPPWRGPVARSSWLHFPRQLRQDRVSCGRCGHCRRGSACGL